MSHDLRFDSRARCEGPGCVLHRDHDGDCRPLYHVSKELCGAWMPLARERCARYAGHAGAVNSRGTATEGHRSRYALDNNRDSRWLGL